MSPSPVHQDAKGMAPTVSLPRSSLCLPHPLGFLGLLTLPLAPCLRALDPALQGYSFVAPSILFDHNNAVMTDVLEAPGSGDRPGRAAVARSAMMQVGWGDVNFRCAGSGLGSMAWVHQVSPV